MVYYFTTTAVQPPRTIFMGEDKHENEELIRWGWPEDVWFHVDKLSSAHVYLRLRKDETLDDVPTSLIEDCAQLCKANSIEGNKKNNIDVVYTMWSNLKKTQGMDVGQVGFHKQKEVRSIHIEKRINETINRLNKTKTEVVKPDLRQQREDRDAEERNTAKQRLKEQKEREKEEEKRRSEEEQKRSYGTYMTKDNMVSNKDNPISEDDFM